MTGYSARCGVCGARILSLPDWDGKPVKLETVPRVNGVWVIRPMEIGGGHYAGHACDLDKERYGLHVCKRVRVKR